MELPYAEVPRTELLAPGRPHRFFHLQNIKPIWSMCGKRTALCAKTELTSDLTGPCVLEDGLTSLLDYARFLQMLVGQGGHPWRPSKESTIECCRPRSWVIDIDWHQGLACAVTNEPAWGWGGYFNTQYFGNAETGEVAVLMKQTHGIRNDSTSSTFYKVLTR